MPTLFSFIMCDSQVPSVELAQGHKLDEFLKKIVAKTKMVRMGCVPLSELGSVKSCILNLKSNGTSKLTN